MMKVGDIVTVYILTGLFNLAVGYDVTSTCKLTKSGTYIADPSSCSGWAYCVDGEVEGRGNCNPGLYYNARTGECEDADNVDCQLSLTTMCNGFDKTYKSNPNDCTQFCYCSNGIATCEKCPDNQIFNSLKGAYGECVWKDGSDFECVDHSPCQLVANNQFLKNEKSCSHFYRCLNGRHIEGKCDSGLNFNYLRGRCVYVKDYPCKSSEIPDENQPEANNQICANSPPENVTKDFYVNDEKTCRGSFVCVDKNDAKPSWTQCPDNTHFSIDEQKCIDTVNVKCEHDRCDGLSNKFATVLNKNCLEYVICRNGVKVGQSKDVCKNKDYPYFDEISQGCVAKKPDYEICQ